MKLARFIITNLIIIISLFLMTLLISDAFNAAMGFISNGFVKAMMFIDCGLGVAEAIIYINLRLKARRKDSRKRRQ